VEQNIDDDLGGTVLSNKKCNARPALLHAVE